MKNIIRLATIFAFVFSSAAFALDPSAAGVYSMKWKNGKVGTYTVTEVTDKTATVTYSYGGKAKTKKLKIKKNKIMGGGWFPTLKIGSNGSVSASHSGSSASVSKN